VDFLTIEAGFDPKNIKKLTKMYAFDRKVSRFVGNEINMEKPLAWFTDFSKWIAEAARTPHQLYSCFADHNHLGSFQGRCLVTAILGSS
jgi:hypothetical protein